jgi:DUF4097 and DUF4098 domain-containing protein YvlB
MRPVVAGAAALAYLTCASPVLAQRFTFDGFFDAAGVTTLDVSTERGSITVVAGAADRVHITAVVTARLAWDSPANAVDVARELAKAPPIEADGSTIRLRPPTDSVQKRAATVSYEVQVPPNLQVEISTDSGAASVRGVSGPVRVRTQSSAIELAALTGPVSATTESGAVSADDLSGGLTVTTSSSGVTARRIASSLQVRTQSGEVDAELSGNGDVDVETGSSAIKVRGLKGGFIANTQSGRVTVDGMPQQPWTVNTGSSSVELALPSGAGLSIDAESRSGDITIEGARLKGAADKHKVQGTVGEGGPLLLIRTGSGAIRLRFAPN